MERICECCKKIRYNQRERLCDRCYIAEWIKKEKNREKMRKWNREWKRKKRRDIGFKQIELKRCKKRYYENREKILKEQKEYRCKNIEKIIEYEKTRKRKRENHKNNILAYTYRNREKFMLWKKNICELCYNGNKLIIHHKKYTKDFNDWMLLCQKCHSIIHRKISPLIGTGQINIYKSLILY